MTGSALALGQKLQDIFLRQSAEFWVLNGGFTVGEVAGELKCTKKTARKYLEMLREDGFVTCERMWYGQVAFYHFYRLSAAHYVAHYAGAKAE